jgi:hypothetical protein
MNVFWCFLIDIWLTIYLLGSYSLFIDLWFSQILSFARVILCRQWRLLDGTTLQHQTGMSFGVPVVEVYWGSYPLPTSLSLLLWLCKSFCELVILAVKAQLWRVFIKSYLDGRWNSGPAGDSSRLVALVIFIGGVTFAEISALRFLSAQVSRLLLVSLFCLILLWVTKTLSLSHWSR